MRIHRHKRAAIAVVVFFLLQNSVAAQPLDPYARGSQTVEVAGTAQFEAWDYNLSREWLAGGALTIGYFVLDRLSINAEASLVRVNQVGEDAALLTVSDLVRWHIRPGPRFSPFVELGFGVAWGSTAVPPRGTAVNYLLQAGGGAMFRLSTRYQLLAGLRWFHISNNGREGRSRNPDIQALGGQAGVAITF